MVLTHAEERQRWEIVSQFHEKDFIKSAGGCRWDPATKLWWTKDPLTAVKFIEFADDAARPTLHEIKSRTSKSKDASRAADCNIEIPAPEGLNYLPFQKAGISFALNVFGDLDSNGKVKKCP